MSQYDNALTAAEQRYGLPSGLLHGMMRTESGGDPHAVSKAGALGLMQFMPATAKAYGIDPLDPAQAIDGAARYMRDNLRRSGGNVSEALRLYQGGPNVAAHGPENAAYAGKVLGAMPGNTSDLAQMGFATPSAGGSNPPATTPAPVAADLGSAGLIAPAADDAKSVMAELDRTRGLVPSPKTAQSEVMGIINNGVAKRLDPAVIKRQVYDYQAANGYDPTKTTGLDEQIAYRQNGGKGALAMFDSVPGKPITNTQKVLQGVKQGVEDVDATVDPIAQWAERKIPGLTAIDTGLGLSTADQAADVHARDRALFNGTLGNDVRATIGRVGGNIAGSAPVLMGGNAVAGRVAGGILKAAPEAAPVIDFLAGNAGKAAVAADGTTTGGNLLVRGASLAAHNAGEGAMAAGATSGGSDAPLIDQLKTGGVAGALLGPAAKIAGAGTNALVEAVAPKVNPIVAQLAQRAGEYGINVRGSQITNSPYIRALDSVVSRIPGTGIADQNASQRAQFTRAVGNTFGADAPNLTPKVMSDARDGISKVYNDVGERTTLDVNPDRGSAFLPTIGQIADNARGVLDTTKIPALDRLIENVTSKIGPDGTIPGPVFKALTSKGSMLDQATQDGNSSFATAAKAVKGALNDALQASAAPEDVAALSKANWQWKNMRTVEKLIAASPDGTISPASLQHAVTANFKDRAYSGAGDLGELGDIGQQFLKPVGTSQTAENAEKLGMLKGAGMLASGLGAHSMGMPIAGDLLAAGAFPVLSRIGGAAVGKLASAALSRDAYRNRLIEAAMNPTAALAEKTGTGGYGVPLAIAGGNRLFQAGTPQYLLPAPATANAGQ